MGLEKVLLMNDVFDFKDILLCALDKWFWMDPCIDFRAHHVQPEGNFTIARVLAQMSRTVLPIDLPSCKLRR